jgi:hypothetical protein
MGVRREYDGADENGKPIPTLAEWREAWEAASDEGRRRTISWEEAERRYYKQYGRGDGHQNGE